MANTKIYGDGESLSVWFALPNYAVRPQNPTAAELNAATEVTTSVAWDGWSFGAQASQQTSDPTFRDVGNTQTRGFAQFGGTISFKYPGKYFPVDPTDENQVTFLALEAPLTLGYIIVRADGKKITGGNPDTYKPAVANDFISIYKVLSDGWSDTNTGEVDFKYTITFQPQGDVWVNAIVGVQTLTAPVAIGAADYTVDGKTPLSGYYTSRQLAAKAGEWSGTPGWFEWSSSDPEVATVDRNGVVIGISAGSADITYYDPIANVTSAALSVTIV